MSTLHYAAAASGDLSEIEALLERSRRDGGEALSEHKATRLRGSVDSRAVVARLRTGKLVAYAQAAWHGAEGEHGKGNWSVEVVIDPSLSDRDAVGPLVKVLREQLPEGDPIAIWSFTARVVDGLRRTGYTEVRQLLKLHRRLPLEHGHLVPASIRIEPFAPGRDDEAWLRLNNRAFSGHPENGGLQQRDLDERFGRDWFDPEGFLLAWEDERLVGSCWTKMHTGGVGEIYIVSVDPDEEGRGIGTGLVSIGSDHLQAVGARSLMLYVDGGNERARRIYRNLGFEKESVGRQFVDVSDDTGQPNRW